MEHVHVKIPRKTKDKLRKIKGRHDIPYAKIVAEGIDIAADIIYELEEDAANG